MITEESFEGRQILFMGNLVSGIGIMPKQQGKLVAAPLRLLH